MASLLWHRAVDAADDGADAKSQKKSQKADTAKGVKKEEKKKKKTGGSSSSSSSSRSSDSDDDGGGGGRDSDDLTSKLAKGAAVEARRGGKEKWFPATVSKVIEPMFGKGVTKYDLDYDDGTKEKQVTRALIRPLKQNINATKSASRGGTASGRDLLPRCEHRGGQRERWRQQRGQPRRG